MVVFKLPESWTNHPEVTEHYLDWVKRHANFTAASKTQLWKEEYKKLKSIYDAIPEHHRDGLEHISEVKFTARIRIFWRNDNAVEESTLIDGVRFGLLRRAGRFVTQGRELARLAGHDIGVDTPEWAQLVELLHKSDADNILAQLMNLHSKITHVVVDQVVETPHAGAADLADELVGGAVGATSFPFLENRFSVTPDGGIVFTSDDPPDRLPNGCLVDALYDTFGPSLRRLWKKKPSDRESLFRRFVSGPGWKATVRDMEGFLRLHRLSAAAFDKSGRQVWNYVPHRRNYQVNPARAYILLHNGHAYRLDKNVSWLAHSKMGRGVGGNGEGGARSERSEDKGSGGGTTSDRYPSLKFLLKGAATTLTSTWPELMAWMASSQGETGKSYSTNWNGDMEALFNDFRARGFEPSVSVTGYDITGLTLHLQNDYRINAVSFDGAEGVRTIPADQWGDWMATLTRWSTGLFAPHLKSTYSPGLLWAWHELPRAQVHCRFHVPDVPTSAHGLDVVRAYTSCLNSIPQLPVFNYLDDWTPATTLGPVSSWYIVQGADPADTEAFLLANREWNMVSGHVLHESGLAHRLKIVAAIAPSNIVANPAPAMIAELYSSGLGEDLRKFTINMLVGLCNKKWNSASRAIFTTSATEAASFSDSTCSAGDGFLSVRSSKVKLADGFLPIGFLVYDTMRLALVKHYRALVGAGLTVYGVATDCFFVDRLPPCALATTKTLATLGALHYDGFKRVPQQVAELAPCSGAVPFPRRCHTRTDKLVPGTIVTASLPGAGKTYLVIRGVPGNKLVLTATNEQAERIRAEYGGGGVDDTVMAMTLCKYLGWRLSDEGLVPGTPTAALPKAPYSIIVDEVYQQSIRLLGDLCSRGTATPIYATGDKLQAPNCEAWSNIPDRGAYLDILATLFPYEYVLPGSRRMGPDDVATLARLRGHVSRSLTVDKSIFGFGLQTLSDWDAVRAKGIKRALTMSNLTAQIVSEKLGGAGAAAAGVQCKTYCRPLALNRTYTVVSESAAGYVLEGVPGVFPKTYFRSPACSTGYSVQGATIDEPYIVMDLTSPNVSLAWFWVCVTRARSLSQVYLWTGPAVGSEFWKAVRARLAGHRASDAAAGLANDLTSDWVVQTAKAQNYHCAICHELMEMECPGDDFVSVNRRDNGVGHVAANCELTHWRCNRATH